MLLAFFLTIQWKVLNIQTCPAWEAKSSARQVDRTRLETRQTAIIRKCDYIDICPAIENSCETHHSIYCQMFVPKWPACLHTGLCALFSPTERVAPRCPLWRNWFPNPLKFALWSMPSGRFHTLVRILNSALISALFEEGRTHCLPHDKLLNHDLVLDEEDGSACKGYP